ncbi:MAG: PCMD domain-containing protein, partial [Muribaculaceae bacterium]
PNTQYTIYAVVDGIATPNVTVTTESATALQYGDMETWEVEAGLTKYWWKSYLGSKSSYWGTMNLVTTSEGGSSTNMFTHNGCAYNAISGTDKTEDKANGTYAAVIRTCGWGGDNAAASNINDCHNITVGSLHLGSSPATADETVNYGISFASRPSSLSFNYKYSPKNSADFGYAEIWVKDANGNVIASKNQNLNAIDAYTNVTLSLSYAEDCPKAAQICVIFRSSNNPDCQTISKDNLSQPPFANLSDGTYMGAQLFIDDVTLNY